MAGMTFNITADDTIVLTDSLAKTINVSLPNEKWLYWNELTQEWEVVDSVYI